jgi:excisionase family DNA binding protein
MKAAASDRRLFSAVRVAEFCGVDLKTVHNWEARGKIRGTRTAGRHLRFRRLDLVEFLRAYGFGVPEALRQGRPRVVVVDSDSRALDTLQKALARRFDVFPFANVVDALVGLVAIDPDVLVLGDVSPLTSDAVAARLATAEATRHVRVVPAHGMPDARALRDRMERLAGLE